jgi:hypothetical protein
VAYVFLFLADPSGKSLGFLMLSATLLGSRSHGAMCNFLVVCSCSDLRNFFKRSENVFHGSVEGGTDTITEYLHSLVMSIIVGSPGVLGRSFVTVTSVRSIAGGNLPVLPLLHVTFD